MRQTNPPSGLKMLSATSPFDGRRRAVFRWSLPRRASNASHRSGPKGPLGLRLLAERSVTAVPLKLSLPRLTVHTILSSHRSTSILSESADDLQPQQYSSTCHAQLCLQPSPSSIGPLHMVCFPSLDCTQLQSLTFSAPPPFQKVALHENLALFVTSAEALYCAPVDVSV